MKAVVCVLALSPLAALAGGSNYGITPGALPNLAGVPGGLSRAGWPQRGNYGNISAVKSF